MAPAVWHDGHMVTTQPSEAQIRNRMTWQHESALRNAVAGRPLGCSGTVIGTLLHWHAVERLYVDGRLRGYVVTDFGRSLIS